MRKRLGLVIVLVVACAGWFAVGRKPSWAPPVAAAARLGGNRPGTDQPFVASSEERLTKAATLLPAVAPHPIPLIDGANPAYAPALELLTHRYGWYLKKVAVGQKMSAEQLAGLANKLAVIRLSLAVHEAMIAEVKSDGKKVVIVIPAYQREGGDMQKYVFDQLVPSLGEGDVKRQLINQFGFFGRYHQKIEVEAGVTTVAGEPMQVYSILHRFDITDGFGPLAVGSYLPFSLLGMYTPFAGFFPKAQP